MMKHILLILSLFVLPCMGAGAKVYNNAGHGSGVATRVAAASSDIKLAQYLEQFYFSEEGKKALLAGAEGNTNALARLEQKCLIDAYCIGAAAAGHAEALLQCIDKGANPDDAIYRAAECGHMDIVLSMLSQGADPDWGIRGAANGGHMNIVEILLNNGADPDKGLAGAAGNGHLNIVKFLLRNGATPDEALWSAAYNGHTDVVKFLLKNGADPNMGLAGAAAGGNKKLVEFMLAQPGVNVNKKDHTGITPINWAMIKGHTECSQLLRTAMRK